MNHSHKVRALEAEQALQTMTAEAFGRYLSDKEAKSKVDAAMRGAKSVVRVLSLQGVGKSEASSTRIKSLAVRYGVHPLLLEFTTTRVKEKLA